jgi:glycosyltransferase involved in cell wall biosynthesis
MTTEWLETFSREERQVAFFGATLIHLLAHSFVDTLLAPVRGRARVIPNTVLDTSGRANPGEALGPKNILAVARLVSGKNISTLIKAFARVAEAYPDWRLRIVGSGPQEKSLKQEARELAIAEQVEFLGEYADPYPFYQEAHLFVIPSVLEGFPLVVIEAMAHGLPVIGYAECNGVNEQIAHGVNGLLSTGDPQVGSLDEDLATLMSDANMRASMGQASRERFDRLYSNRVVFDAWEQLFMEALEAETKSAHAPLQHRLNTRLEELVWGGITVSKPDVF